MHLAKSSTKPKVTPASKTELATIWTAFSNRNHHGYAALYGMPSIERATLVKNGAPSNMVDLISKEMAMSKDRFVQITGLSRATVTRKIANKAHLSVDESERLVGLAKLIGQVETIVQQSGNSDGFNAAKWFGEWMEHPAAALGGMKPETLLDTSDGRDAISKLLSQMQSGAYA